MIEFKFRIGEVSTEEQEVISSGFARHSDSQSAPRFSEQRLNWLAFEGPNNLVGALTADLLWDWMYIDEFWVEEHARGQHLGTSLLNRAEEYAAAHALTGVWLWTQSWQAETFYLAHGYTEFTRFPDFPKGHTRIGFRKLLETRPSDA